MSGKISHDRACEMINALFAEKLKEKEDEVDVLDDMSVTLAVLHFERSALNLEAE